MKAIAFFDKKVNNGIYGSIFFEQKNKYSPLIMDIDIGGFDPLSTHAIHIHEFGDLTEGCKSLGGHFHVYGKNHGHSEKGHEGDLFNNFQTDRDGKFIATFTTRKLSIFTNSELSIIGRSVVIHKFPDDYGLQGQVLNNNFILYKDMSSEQLRYICNRLNYKFDKRPDRFEMITKLINESLTTGNASTRIACSIIGFRKN